MQQLFSKKNYRGFYESFGYIDAGSTPSDFPLFVGFVNGKVIHKDVEQYIHAPYYEMEILFGNEDLKTRSQIYTGVKRGKITFTDYPVRGSYATNIAELFFEVFLNASPDELSELSKLYYASTAGGNDKVKFRTLGRFLYAKYKGYEITYIADNLPADDWSIDLVAANYVFHNRKPYLEGKVKINTDVMLTTEMVSGNQSVHVIPAGGDSEVKKSDAVPMVHEAKVSSQPAPAKANENNKSKKGDKQTQTSEVVITRTRIRRTFSSRE